MGWDGGGRVTTCETVCHVCCTSSEEYHTNPTPVECPTVSVYQRQGGVGWGGEELQLVRQCAMYVVLLVRNTTPNLHQ